MTTTKYGIVSDIARGADWLDDGNGNFSQLRESADPQFANKRSTTTGLTYGYFGGSTVSASGVVSSVTDGTVVLTDDDTNYVERTVAGVVSTNTSGFTTGQLPMAMVVTSSGDIASIEDRRVSASQVPTGLSPTGAAGGVLGGTYPNPSFAADMATQAELDAVAALKADLAGATFAGAVEVPDDPYDATGWNGSAEVPTKNAIRDKIEALGGASNLDGLSDVVITSPTLDEVLKYNGTNWVNDAAPSGGTVLYEKWDPMVPDASPHALNAEFDSSSLAAWTVVNSRGTINADTTATGKLFMDLPDLQYRWVAYLQAIPADTNWTIHTKVWVAANPAASLLTAAGIVISDTNTTNSGKQTGVNLCQNAVAETNREIENWDNFGETAAGASVTNYPIGGSHSYIRVRKESGTYYAAWSGDGETWFEVSFSLYGSITPAYIGLYSQNYSSINSQTSFDYFRYYANGTQYRTGAAVNVLG